MYFPYLRGKQFELILLRDNLDLLANSQITPIIEPVKENFTALIRTVKVLNEKKVECIIIVNPQAGLSPVKPDDILSDLIENEFRDFNNVSIGYILHAESRKAGLTGLLKKYEAKSFALIHYGFMEGKELSVAISNNQNIKHHIFIDGHSGKLYRKSFKNGSSIRILVRDGFKQQKKNALYPPMDHFSDLHITYDEELMDGFGDFLIVGDDYTETGGPAYAVAIHLTYLNSEDDDMFIHHFISNQTDSPVDPGGKFLEALEKLVAELKKDNSSLLMTEAGKEYLRLYDKQHFPGLGTVKKLSMQHHIELIADYQSRA